MDKEYFILIERDTKISFCWLSNLAVTPPICLGRMTPCTSMKKASGTIALDYGIYGVPETFFIDAQGVIRHKQIGGVTAKLLSQQKEILVSL